MCVWLRVHLITCNVKDVNKSLNWTELNWIEQNPYRNLVFELFFEVLHCILTQFFFNFVTFTHTHTHTCTQTHRHTHTHTHTHTLTDFRAWTFPFRDSSRLLFSSSSISAVGWYWDWASPYPCWSEIRPNKKKS
jgi:hypothetical protein